MRATSLCMKTLMWRIQKTDFRKNGYKKSQEHDEIIFLLNIERVLELR